MSKARDEFNLEDLREAADYLANRISSKPKLLIICGTGLGSLADLVENPVSINYEEIPHFPVSTVQGHHGRLVFGTLSHVNVVCMQGRFHYFEGYSVREITKPIRIMKLLGVEGLFITNSAGGLNPQYKVGDVMILKDHFNFLSFGGENPLRGPNDDNFGDRFIPTNKAYNKKLISIARDIAKQVGLKSNCHEGVYAIVSGPNYETVAESRALLMLGVDAVGMSTVPEVIVAKHCGMTVFGFSFITNLCITSYDTDHEPNHGNILDSVESRSVQIQNFVIKMVEASKDLWKSDR
ncbi:purine nucleoside phosphorylase-like [Sitophilus oryzae]|uniref:Purine nucleoside phosphorylase n=1 Tax=Sitophilus oryzae TaxID=7048 RepID=A0A6J2YMA9_SITOR|nr:purine nucleoside phosphorylase-like [Sitophilus oryzae]